MSISASELSQVTGGVYRSTGTQCFADKLGGGILGALGGGVGTGAVGLAMRSNRPADYAPFAMLGTGIIGWETAKHRSRACREIAKQLPPI